MRILALLLIGAVAASAGKYDKVKITPDISYIYAYHKGKAVKVHRIQDTKNKLTGEYAKIFRPGKDIQPIKMHDDIRTIAEVEVLNFMKDKVNKRQGLLVDLRPKADYRKETIPASVNIPASVKDNPAKLKKIMKIFGVKKLADGSLDTSKALEIAFYCNGLWCDKSSEFIQTMLDNGYPADKMLYYRGGFQMWKILGFTTIVNK